jgi:hypothetical protein
MMGSGPTDRVCPRLSQQLNDSGHGLCPQKIQDAESGLNERNYSSVSGSLRIQIIGSFTLQK